MENKNEMKQEVVLITTQLLNFKADDGKEIKGIKIFYLVNSDNENFSNGKLEDVFFKTEDIDKTFKGLKNYQLDCKDLGTDSVVTLIFTIESIKSRPKLKNIQF